MCALFMYIIRMGGCYHAKFTTVGGGGVSASSAGAGFPSEISDIRRGRFFLILSNL
jgi:hypothetical protein